MLKSLAFSLDCTYNLERVYMTCVFLLSEVVRAISGLWFELFRGASCSYTGSQSWFAWAWQQLFSYCILTDAIKKNTLQQPNNTGQSNTLIHHEL